MQPSRQIYVVETEDNTLSGRCTFDVASRLKAKYDELGVAAEVSRAIPGSTR